MSESVKVAVRVRPFNSREKDRGSKLVIRMRGNQTSITNPNTGEDKKFTFDHSYWSHDGFTERPDGYLEPKEPKYADQMKVFDDLGQGVLNNSWKGYNCSLFAYGQTGSGKSYSMIGYNANKGIVPIVCEKLFAAIAEKQPSLKDKEELRVSISMIEIYSEQVRDLFSTKAVKGGMKVREHPTKGFYVENLKSAPVTSYAEIDAKINEGSRNRTVASTNMNATSSRAHTIVAIQFTQKMSDASGQSMTKTSVMNLVDLAGSERAESTGATGDRLKEGAAINKSLSTLGNCIKALADQAGGNKKVKVPFRDSVLTKLLKNALGGNSKTVMIAALSPADINYDETLSTLRFADRAKSIKTKAVVNESPTDKLIRELREENARLMALLKAGGGAPGGGGEDDDDDEDKEEQMRELVRKNQEEMEAMEKAWAQRLEEAHAEAQAKIAEQQQESERKKNVPHLWNLNEDPALSGMIVHFCDPGTHVVGKEGEFQLKGVNILSRHAQLKNSGGSVTLTPIDLAKVYVNGKEVQQETRLRHHDRVLFGTNHLYVFHHPVDYAQQLKLGVGSPDPPTFELAQEEIAENSGVMGLLGDKVTSRNADDMVLMEDLVRLYPQVQEANAMSEELDRRVKFELVLMSPQGRGLREGEGRTEVFVSLVKLDSGNEFFWTRDKFSDRKYLMRDMYNNYVEGSEWELPPDQDPFNEPDDTPVLIGTSHVYLQSLSYLIEVAESFSVTDFRGEDQGRIELELRPCDAQGNELEDSFAEPDDLVGARLDFKIKIHNGRDLPAKFASYFVQYKFYLEDEYTKTDEAAKSVNAAFDFVKMYNVKTVTKQFIEYLQHSYIILEVWGRQRSSDRRLNKTTKELMSAEKSKLQEQQEATQRRTKAKQASHGSSEEANKLRAELELMRKEKMRGERKLKKLQTMVNEAQKKGSDNLDVQDVDAILSSTGDPQRSMRQAAMAVKAINHFVTAPEVAEKRQASMGKATSATCAMQ